VPTEKSIQNAYISLIENAERKFSLPGYGLTFRFYLY